MSRYCAEPSQGHDQQDETRVQSIHDFPVKAGFTGESDKFRSPSALARANAGFEAMAPCYGWRSPHTRGALGEAPELLGEGRIIPAYAGSTTPWRSTPEASRDHPRIRGEHPLEKMRFRFRSGSSPHTRGAHHTCGAASVAPRIIPAYAGSTAPKQYRLGALVGSSPHTRGARVRSARPGRRGRIIPAYAGSTLRRNHPIRRTRDHPRIRGEHGQVCGVVAAELGSSPHTRGAPRYPVHEGQG